MKNIWRMFFEPSPRKLLESAKSEDFEIKLKNKDGKDRIFGINLKL